MTPLDALWILYCVVCLIVSIGFLRPSALAPLARLGERLGLARVFDALVRLLDTVWAATTAPIRRFLP